MPNRAFSLELKSLTEQGEFSGLAAVYGNTDSAGDIILPGAFQKTLSSSKERPLLWQHRDPIGSVQINDSPTALTVKGKLLLGVQQARDAYELMKAQIVKGLSIGFETVRSDYVGNVRHLKEIRLWEVSLVTFPANELATITQIKSAEADQVRAALKDFRNGVLDALERK